MRAVHFFGKLYGWSKRDVLLLTTEEANYLYGLAADEATWREQLAKQRR